MSLPKVAIISLGGTISSLGARGVAPKLTAKELVEDVPRITEHAHVVPIRSKQLPSSAITFGDLLDVSDEVRRQFESGTDGVVITQGTDTMEETAFFFDVVVDSDKPVVVTGAMRNPTLPGNDGPSNLLSAVQVAATKKARGLGTLVVINEEIHLARYVQKTHTSSISALESPLTGPVGWITEGEVTVALRPGHHPHITIERDSPEKRVALLKVVLDDDGALLDAMEPSGFDGLVVEGTGGGHVPPVMASKIARLAKKIPVVLSSRTGSGQVLRHTYGHPGAEIDLISKGMIPAMSLSGPKARVLLYLLLRSGRQRKEIGRAFQEWS